MNIILYMQTKKNTGNAACASALRAIQVASTVRAKPGGRIRGCRFPAKHGSRVWHDGATWSFIRQPGVAQDFFPSAIFQTSFAGITHLAKCTNTRSNWMHTKPSSPPLQQLSVFPLAHVVRMSFCCNERLCDPLTRGNSEATRGRCDIRCKQISKGHLWNP